jgi:hypothetical protein
VVVVVDLGVVLLEGIARGPSQRQTTGIPLDRPVT